MAERPFVHLNYADWPHIDNQFLRVSLDASLAAGQMLHQGFYSKFESYVKDDKSEFTPFDKEAERIARSVIADNEAAVGGIIVPIMGEDISPNEDISGKNFWVIDGIDGTTNFSRRIPFCNFTMAYVEDGKTQVGTVYDFLSGELFYAVRDQGAYLNGEPIRVSDRPFTDSLISFAPLLDVRKGKGQHEGECVEATWKGMKQIVEDSKRFPREMQSGGLELAYVACGRFDGYASSWTNPWDLSAGVALVKEAGGRATNIIGNDWEPSYWGVVAGNPEVHADMLTRLEHHLPVRVLLHSLTPNNPSRP